jgi:serine/threonine-protein kinase RIO1
MRTIFNNKDYSKEGRLNNLRNVNNIARFLEYKGYDVFVSVVAPYNDIRDELRDLDINYYYVHTTETRGREDYFASDFEFNDSDIKINTTNKSVTESLNEVFTIHR